MDVVNLYQATMQADALIFQKCFTLWTGACHV